MPRATHEGGRKIAIVGCGGVGFYAASTIAQVSVGQEGLIAMLGLFDADRLEARNIGRVPLFPYVRDRYMKVEALKHYLSLQINSTLPILSNAVAITAGNIGTALQQYDTVICCSDDVENQRIVQVWCRQQGKQYQRAGYDGDMINVCTQIPLTFDEVAEKADAGYHGVPEAYHAILAGTLAAYSVLRQPVVVMGEVKNLSITGTTLVPAHVSDAIVAERWEVQARQNSWHAQGRCNHYEFLSTITPGTLMDYIPSNVGLEYVDRLARAIGQPVWEAMEARHRAGHRTRRTWCPYCREALRNEQDAAAARAASTVAA